MIIDDEANISGHILKENMVEDNEMEEPMEEEDMVEEDIVEEHMVEKDIISNCRIKRCRRICSKLSRRRSRSSIRYSKSSRINSSRSR